MTPESFESRSKTEKPEAFYVPPISEQTKQIIENIQGRLFVVGFNGSLKPKIKSQEVNNPGRTEQLLINVLQTIESYGGYTVLINLADIEMGLPSTNIGEYSEQYSPEQRDDDVTDMLELVRNADAIVTATPVYWFSRSSLLQLLWEHFTKLEESYQLEGKVIGLIATEDEEGASDVIKTQMLAATHMGMIVAPYSGIFSRGPGRDYKWVKQDVGDLGIRILKMCQATKGIDWDTPPVKEDIQSFKKAQS